MRLGFWRLGGAVSLRGFPGGAGSVAVFWARLWGRRLAPQGRGGGRGWLRRAGVGLLAVCLVAAQGCAAPVQGGPALWRLKDDDSEIYLLGTVHVLPPSLKWRSARIERAFAKADLVYFETPTDAEAQAELAALVRVHGVTPPGVTLSSLLTRQDRAALARVAGAVGVELQALERMRPWLAALQLSVAYVIAQGQSTASGVERVLEEEARRANKKRAYFETPEQQIRFFADLPPAVEREFLTVTLAQIEQQGRLVGELDQVWARGDVARLSTLLNGLLVQSGPEIYAALIVERNARWVEEIDRLMQGSGVVFVAVGAAHLVGKDSVAEMLRAKGYVVEGPRAEP